MSGAAADAPPGLFVGLLAPFADLLSAEVTREAVPLATLLDDARPVLDRFALRHRTPDRCAAASLWTQVLFVRLLVPALVLATAGRRVSLAPDALSVVLCPDSAEPLRFVGRLEAGVMAGGALAVDLAGTIAALRRATGLGHRLLADNAVRPLVWAARERSSAAPHARVALEPQLDELLRMAGVTVRAAALLDRPTDAPPRRTCCLRDRVPGLARCPEGCPLQSRHENAKILG